MGALYDKVGVGYRLRRRPDPRWQAAVDEAVGGARTVLNVGAGTGSYEPSDRYVLAVEPSAEMIAQRPPDAAPAVRAVAERLPVADGRFELATAFVTLHHWADWAAGLRELRRVADRVVVLHFMPRLHDEFWLVTDYLPELREAWRDTPGVDEVVAVLGGATSVRVLPLAADHRDGLLNAYWRRPEAYLDPGVRTGMSAMHLVDPAALAGAVEALRADLADGSWRSRHADLLSSTGYDAGWRLITS